MAEQRQHIDDFVRKELNDYQEAPRADLWDKIEANLDKTDTGSRRTKPAGADKRLWFGLGVLLLCITGGFVAYNTLHNDGNGKTGAVVRNNNTVVSNTATETNTGTTDNSALNNNSTGSSNTNPREKSINGNSNNQNLADSKISGTNTNASVTTGQADQANRQKETTVTLANNNNTAITTIPVDQNNISKVSVPNAVKTEHVTELASNDQKPINTQPVSKNNIKEVKVPKAIVKQDVHTMPLADNDQPVKQEGINKQNANTVTVPKVTTESQNSERIKSGDTMKLASNDNKPVNTLPVTPGEIANTTVPPVADGTKANDQPAKKQNNKSVVHKTGKRKKTTAVSADSLALASKAGQMQQSIEKQKQDKGENQDIVPNSSAYTNMGDKKGESPTGNSQDLNNAGSGPGGGMNEMMNLNVPGAVEGGVKLSVERGFGQYTTNKIAASFYIQKAFTGRFGVSIIPSVKFTMLSSPINYGSHSYYKNANPRPDSTKGSTDSLFYYTIYQQYDSVVVNRKSNTSYIGFEVPIVARYQFSDKFTLFGGINIDISRLFMINDNQTSSIPISRVVYTSKQQEHPYWFADTLKNFKYTYFSPEFTPTQQANSNPIRIGYIFGIDYNLKEKLFMELSIIQNLSDQAYIPDQNIRSIYTQPYFRFSIGYRLFDPADKKKRMNR
jgi:hypothetical protein